MSLSASVSPPAKKAVLLLGPDGQPFMGNLYQVLAEARRQGKILAPNILADCALNGPEPIKLPKSRILTGQFIAYAPEGKPFGEMLVYRPIAINGSGPQTPFLLEVPSIYAKEKGGALFALDGVGADGKPVFELTSARFRGKTLNHWEFYKEENLLYRPAFPRDDAARMQNKADGIPDGPIVPNQTDVAGARMSVTMSSDKAYASLIWRDASDKVFRLKVGAGGMNSFEICAAFVLE